MVTNLTAGFFVEWLMCFCTGSNSRSTSAGDEMTGWRRYAITIDYNFTRQVVFWGFLQSTSMAICCLDTFINSHLAFLRALVQFLVCPGAPNAPQINIQIMRFLDLMKNLINSLPSIASFSSLLYSDHTSLFFSQSVNISSFPFFSSMKASVHSKILLTGYFRLNAPII